MPRKVWDLSADDPPFDPDIWIGKGKKFPKKATQFEVHDALADVLKLPDTHTSLIPAPDLPLPEFIQLSFPKQSTALVFSKPQSWFSKDPPTTAIDCLLTRPIPSLALLGDLEKAVGQAWLDGSRSIVDSRYNEGRDRLPLWGLTLWIELARVVRDQKMWQRSGHWLTTELGKAGLESSDREALMTANSLLGTLGWDTRIQGEWTMASLAIILTDAWLSDDHINMMMIDLSARVAADPELAAKLLIAPLAFSEAIKTGAAKAKYTREETPLLSKYEDHIKRKCLEQLYFPVHINENHWIAGLVDFKQGLIGTGDSRVRLSPPAFQFLRALKRWLKKQFGRDFVYQGDSLEHGDQKDSSSCAIVTRNTVAVNTVGEVLWEQKHAAAERATCFVRLVRSAAIREKVIAIGDHNFPDLAEFALHIPPRQSRPTLADLMNPAPEAPGVAESTAPAMDMDMADTLAPGYSDAYVGDHGDIDAMESMMDDPHAADESQELEEAPMDVDEELPAPRKSIMSYFAPAEKLGKRSRDAADSELDESVDIDPSAPAKKAKKANGTGSSKSAVSAQKTRDARKSGALTVATADPVRYRKWQDTLRNGKGGKNGDPKVVFHATDVKKARHSLCGYWVTMGEVYEAGRWNLHMKSACPALNPGKKKKIGDGLLGVPTLQGLGWGAKKDSDKKPSRPTLPCPGITPSTCPRLPIYLRRTGASGGGARSVTAIARSLFGKLALFRRLTGRDREDVVDTQRHERQWVNDHAKQRVFSTRCKKHVLAAGLDGSRTLPCSECSLILGNARFKQAIRLPIPDDENYIYVNRQFRNQELGELYARTIGLKEIIETTDAKNTPCIKFAQGTLEGKYTDFKVFGGLVEAMVQKADRVERGVGMQNFKYPPAWDEMAHIINIHSPRAARALGKHIPIRTQRSFREKESREPRFPMEIEDRTFTLVKEHLAALNYDGPVGLSCDDTKLFAGLRLYTDKDKQDFLVGGVDGPIRVADPEAMKRLLADPTIVKGTKVRLWCLTIPLPGITPLVVAALPIRDNMTADQLLDPLEKILYGLLDLNIRVVSYAADGTETERLLQRKLVEKADKVIHYKITNPVAGAPDLELHIATFRGYPVVMIQDAKHGLKTFRNNLFTGAKLFTMGNYTAIFRRIFEMAMARNSPMYRRDVLRLDRQDDAAACRLFCAAVLEWLTENHPEHIGEIVYLFIFGELIDAYQSREITHKERIKLALRARYFLDAWAKYLQVAGYKQQQYFMSREAVDIAKFLIEGIISLIIVYRDHVPGVVPLLPWFHSSEPCEHTFADSRNIVKDFTFLDFIYMAPKLRVTMREAVLSGKASDEKWAAQGYKHTYFDTVGADIAKLATYPSDDEIKQASEEAAAECESVIALLGISPAQLYENRAAPLPGIGTWFSDEPDDVEDTVEDFDDELPDCDAEELQALIDAEERLDAPSRSVKADRELMSLTCASIAVSADDYMRIQEFQQVDEDLEEEILGEEFTTLRDTMASLAALPAVQLPSEPSKPFGHGTSTTFATLDFKALIRQRTAHQTREAAHSARVKTTADGDDETDDIPVPKESTRRQILRKYHELLKESDQTRAVRRIWGFDTSRPLV
ncbi:hypothetical protein C8R47DRAFT_1028273 [Mycena vitilis]|nr:hypothetical protein C8R47DRAFT_1028273 [Mycena vitilis]